MSGVVLVCGEALVDLVPAADGTVAAHLGGGPFNVARTVGRLGQPVVYLGRLSSDTFGRRLRAALDADGVTADALAPTALPTTLALAEVDPEGVARYVFYAAATSAPDLPLDDASAALPGDVAVLYAGTLGLVFEPIASTVEALVGRAGESTLVALDPNVRPAAIPDPGAYRARLDRLLARADLVKVSEEDLAHLSPGKPPLLAASELVSGRGAVALLTLGERGAVVVTGSDWVEVPAPRVTVADTIGAGDAFMGAVLAWWRARGLTRADLSDTATVAEATRFAVTVAARTCARPGADPPRLAELDVRP